MISVEGLKVEFNATPLFEDVSYVINKKDRIALVGKNGAGKSTMLKILAGLQQIDTSELGGDVWLLSDIPLLGELFQANKNNLPAEN